MTSRGLSAAGALAIATSATTLLVAERFGTDYVPDGVRIDGILVGGLSREEAVRQLERHARERLRRPVRLEGPDRTITTTGVDLHMEARLAEALNRDRVGRVGLVRHWLGIRGSRNLALRYDVPARTVQALATRLGSARPVDASIAVSDDGILVRAGRSGLVVDAAAFRSQLDTLPRRVRVRTIPVAPRVSTMAAEIAARRAQRLTDDPRTLVIGAKAYTLAPRELRSLLAIRREETGFRIEFDRRRLARFLPSKIPPRDATFATEGAQIRVVPAVAGRAVDLAATAVALADSTRRTVRVAVTFIPPAVATSDLVALRIREQVSAFTTFYPPAQPRVVNIKRASAVIDGTVLRPSETFSMNKTLGRRTVEKGYVAAPQIVGSSFADSVGGGISQVATMLYNGAFFAGLELIEHQPHSLYIDRYPLGREATISWGGPELIFRNDWPAAVLIRLETTDNSITVRFFSSRLGRRVETHTYPPYGHGGGGFTVEYTRRVFRGLRLIKNERYRVRYGVASSVGGGR